MTAKEIINKWNYWDGDPSYSEEYSKMESDLNEFAKAKINQMIKEQAEIIEDLQNKIQFLEDRYDSNKYVING